MSNFCGKLKYLPKFKVYYHDWTMFVINFLILKVWKKQMDNINVNLSVSYIKRMIIKLIIELIDLYVKFKDHY